MTVIKIALHVQAWKQPLNENVKQALKSMQQQNKIGIVRWGSETGDGKNYYFQNVVRL